MRTPLNEVLVRMHGPAKAADILTRLFLVEAWPTCPQPCTCKGRCGGKPSDVFRTDTIATVQQWVTALHQESSM